MAIRKPSSKRQREVSSQSSEARDTDNRTLMAARVEPGGKISIPRHILELMKLSDDSPVEIELSLEGMIVRPLVSGRDPDQWWFWTDEWQEGEREVESQAGSSRTRHSTEEFIEALERAARGRI